MENLSSNILSAFIASGGVLTIVGLFGNALFEKKVREAVKPEFEEIRKELQLLRDELNKKQSKEVCGINHNNIDRRLESIEQKLDKLIDMKGE